MAEGWDLSYLWIMSWFIFSPSAQYLLFLAQMILGASKGILFSYYHCHLLQLYNFISNLSVHIHRSACADTKQAQNNTKIIPFIHPPKVSSPRGDGCELPVSSCRCPTWYPQKSPGSGAGWERKGHLPFRQKEPTTKRTRLYIFLMAVGCAFLSFSLDSWQ